MHLWHRWGPWVSGRITYSNNGRQWSRPAQQRTCRTCGKVQVRETIVEV